MEALGLDDTILAMERHWQPGDVILMEFITRTGKLINVMPEIVVEDNDLYLAVVSVPV